MIDGSVARPATPLAAVTHPDPYPYYAGLVARTPLARDAGLGLWVAASAEAVTGVLTSERCRVRPVEEPVPKALVGTAVGEIFSRLVRMNDGPRHAALKPTIEAIVAAARGADATAQRWARRLGEELTPSAHPERLTHFASALAVSVMAELIGIPVDMVPAVTRWTGPFVRAMAPGADAETIALGAGAASQLLELAHSLPTSGDGMLANLVGQAPGDREAVIANAIGFLSQAHDATAGLIGNTVVALSRMPELRATVRAAPGALARVVTEVARHDAPVQNTRRFVAEDGIVGGTQMRAGDAILVLLAAANRDPAVNADPARFDHERIDPRVFTFGLGPHACPGAMLAVTIAAAAVGYLLDAGIPLDDLATRVTYRSSPNARIPSFGAL